MFNLNLRPGHPTDADVTLAESGVLGFQVQLFAGHTDAADVILREGIFYAVADAPGGSPVTYAYTGAGGFVFGGTSSYSRSITYTASGGVIFADTSAITITHVPPASGGKVFGGSAVTEFVSLTPTVYTYSPSGGLTFSGNAESSFVSSAPAASGGMWKWAGRKRNNKPKHFGFASSGGLRLGGSAPVSRTRSVTARITQRSGRAASPVAFSRNYKTSKTRVAFSGRSRCRLVSVPVFVPAKKVDTAAIVAAARHARRTREEAEVAMIMSQF